jgi:DNA-directed RNA polymerase specialized sigma24 family protein
MEHEFDRRSFLRVAGTSVPGCSRSCATSVTRKLSRSRTALSNVVFDEEQHQGADPAADAETAALTRIDREALTRALEALPVEYREVIVMREMEGLSY